MSVAAGRRWWPRLAAIDRNEGTCCCWACRDAEIFSEVFGVSTANALAWKLLILLGWRSNPSQIQAKLATCSSVYSVSPLVTASSKPSRSAGEPNPTRIQRTCITLSKPHPRSEVTVFVHPGFELFPAGCGGDLRQHFDHQFHDQIGTVSHEGVTKLEEKAAALLLSVGQDDTAFRRRQQIGD